MAGKQAKRADGKLPPHVMVYLAMALALFADDDDEEVAARLAGTLMGWGCWDAGWEVPTSGEITQARQRLGEEPLRPSATDHRPARLADLKVEVPLTRPRRGEERPHGVRRPAPSG
ncbi:transposase domain-containing protein [Streptomyces sp. NPDC051320]|uniref:transposase domain-containing protein n=1 Tax=Streptomyces sp. NPDC051320 TaxID=3154644 RepID=UPI0034444C57